MTIVAVGLDIAKQIFQVHGLDRACKLVLRKRLRRTEVSSFFAGVEPCLIGLEASGGAHYWFRVLSRLGHTVCLIAPQFVKPYVKLQKNDANDAAAICEAVSRPSMRAAGCAMPALGVLPADRVPDTVGQSNSRAAGGIRDCSSAACCSVVSYME
jgi:transposase